MKTALDQDPEFRFNAKPPAWMIGLVVLWAIGINLTSALIIDIIDYIAGTYVPRIRP